ncbi:stress activated MAP kinase interacting protein Sin1 [Pseudohyphozyma bogoriensis]|nr:stress activated MAP kinase interacting protein Sin1 [Pseudohyphozyma bogoriensis]
MSLLSDREYAIHSLQLNFIRHVLPSHAVPDPARSSTTSNPYNLIAFPPSSSLSSSPYIHLSQADDDALWPELAAGRHSPPLGTVVGREHGTRRGRGLQYSQTIGKGVGGAGMRVDGRGRTWKGKRVLDTTATEDDNSASQDKDDSTDAERRGPAFPLAPPVVIHSPVRTPQSSHPPTIRPTPLQSLIKPDPPPPIPPADPTSLLDTASPSPLSPLSTSSTSPVRAPPLPSTSLSSTSSPISPLAHSLSLTASHSPLSTSTPASPLNAVPESPLSPALSTPTSLPDQEEEDDDADSGVLVNATSASASETDLGDPGIRFASGESSGVSLFGSVAVPLSLASNGTGGVGVNGGVGDTDSAPSLVAPAFPSPVAVQEEEPASAVPTQPAPVPTFQLPRGMRTRERRRVNISAARAMLVPLSEAANEDDHSSHGGIVPTPAPASVEAEKEKEMVSRPRSNTDPNGVSEEKVDGAKAKGEEARPNRATSSPSLTRKHSAPSLLPSTEEDDAAATVAPPPSTASPALIPPPAVAPLPTTTPTPTLTVPTPSPRQPPAPFITFTRRSLPPSTSTPAPRKSALTSLLTSSSSAPSNPYAPLYSSLVARPSAPDALPLSLFFPHSTKPGASTKLRVVVRRDVTVEEVIGVGLLSYWEEDWEPKLEPGGEGEEEEETVKWNLRIVEDDGEVDEDFPALDRTRAIKAFSFNMFAIVQATNQQVKDNKTKQASIQRRPSRVLAPQKRSPGPQATVTTPPLPLPPPAAVAAALNPNGPANGTGNNLLLPGQQTLAVPGAAAGTGVVDASFKPSTTGGVSSSLAIPVLLKVRLPPAPGVQDIVTTVQVPNDMYMSDVLDHICKKRGPGFENPKEWSLIVHHNDMDIVVPLDRTVDSLKEGDGDSSQTGIILTLVRRPQVPALKGKPSIGNTNPSASIFKRLSEPPQPKYQSASELNSAVASSQYQRWFVQRKLPMPMGRHPRTIAIDGDYIHFMATDSRGHFDGGRTSSFHISNIHECKVSRRAPNSFKLLVQKDRVDKRYDFEAESPKQAQEIVAAVKGLMEGWKKGNI